VDENENDDRARSVIASFASLSGQSRHRPVASHRHTASHRPSHPSIHPSTPLEVEVAPHLLLIGSPGNSGNSLSAAGASAAMIRARSFVRSFVRRWTARRTLWTIVIIARGHPRARGATARREAAARAVARTVEMARASDSRGGERDETRASEMRGEMRGSVRGATRRAVTRRGRRR